MKKILIIRFSSIGDIVLTTPIVRCLKKQFPSVEIHYVTKNQYLSLLISNPYINKIHTIENSVFEVIEELKNENFDFVIDLHKNWRAFQILFSLLKPYATFSKLNFKKWLLTSFKINLLPDIHIVERYFKALKKWEIINDNKGLDYFFSENVQTNIISLPENFKNGFVAMVIGSKHYTKQLPLEQTLQYIKKLDLPIVLLGDDEDAKKSEFITQKFENNILDFCGKLKLDESVSILNNAKVVVTHDTGLMHIAAALHKPIISIWGNTVPAFGMYPYMPVHKNFEIIEVLGLKCRPCSKLGYKKCPKNHFNCMNQIDIDLLVDKTRNLFQKQII